MKSQHARIVALTVGIILFSLTFANAAHADNVQATRQFLAGSGFLCSLAPTACPDITSASNGDKVLLTGSGTFTPGDDDASGGGTFTHMSGTTVVGSGTWKAETLVSFTSFGPSPSAPPNAEGGQAVLKVELKASSGAEFDAVLVVGCTLDATQAAIPGAFEGIRLNINGGPNFNMVAPFPNAGFTVFIVTP